MSNGTTSVPAPVVRRDAGDAAGLAPGEDHRRQNDASFRAFMEQAPFSVQMLAPDGRTLRVNRAWEKLWGLTLADVAEYNLLADPQLEANGVTPYLRRAFAGESVSIPTIEFDPAKALPVAGGGPDGVRWVSAVAYPLKDAQGVVREVVLVHEDVTARVRAEQAVAAANAEQARARAQLEAVVNTISDGILVTDPTGALVIFNPAANRMHGYHSPEDARHNLSRYRDVFEVADAAGRAVAFADWPLMRVLRGESFENWELRIRRTDIDHAFVANYSGAPVRDEAGRVVLAVAIVSDITERKRVEAALRQSEEKLERTVAERTTELRETNEQMEAFVYSMAHDLRGPLRSLSGYSRLLLDDHGAKLDDNGRHMLGRIQASSEFMDKLLLDLLAYGRTARAPVDLAGVEVTKAWQAAVFQCRGEIERANAAVSAGAALDAVVGHETTLGQCLANLLSNAVKFVAPGVRPSVRFWTERRGDRVRLWLADNGLGIPPAQHERMFRAFERLHGAQYPGTGIGLAIVRKGVERMGGTIGVDSDLGAGSRFWIELPGV